MKKLILIMFIILLVGSVSAFEFDNVKNYDEETKTVDIRNSVLGIPFLQLGKVAEIKLNTPTNYLVPRGYQKVAEFEVIPYSDYSDAFKELELYDKKDNDKKFVRDFDYKYKTIIQVPDYKYVCDESLSENGTVKYNNCREEEKGLKDKIVWEDLALSDFKDGEVKTIGIFTEVKKGDKVEWIPNFFGVRINEWAVWTEDLNVDLVIYYKLEEISGAVNDSTGFLNGTNTNATTNVTGIIERAYDFERDDNGDRIETGLFFGAELDRADNFSVSMWFKPESFAANNFENVLMANEGGAGVTFSLTSGNSEIGIFIKTTDEDKNIQAGTLTTGNFFNVVVVYDRATIRVWLNGTNIINSSFVDEDDIFTRAPEGEFWLGNAEDFSTTREYDGVIDEVAVWNRTLLDSEVEDLYNNATGITWRDVFLPEIIINSPANNSNFSVSNVTFNATVTSDNTITNVTLFIDGIANESNTSGVQGIYLFEKNFSDGTFLWNINVTDDVPSSVNSSIRTFTIDTTAPSVIINTPTGRQSNIKLGDNQTVTWNITDLNLDTCVLDYNGANRTLNCTANTTGFLYVNGVNTLNIFANDTFGMENTTTTTWDYNITQINQTFNSPVFTTSTQAFEVNITINSDFTDAPTAASIIHNGTTTTGGTVTSIGGDNYTLSQTIDIPDIVNGTSDWLFSFTLNSSLLNSSTSQQTIFRLALVNCDTSPFINFTFKNETLAEEDVNASFDSIWNYFLGSGSIFRTLSFLDATENPSYAFCLNAANDTLFTQVNISYTNSISQQRQFRPTLLTLTNATTNQILYLLPTVDGLFNTFRTEDTLGNTIVGALGTITRTLGGSPITSAIDVTDGSGLVVFFLDPDITYTATFSKSGFANNVFTFVPTTDLRTVIMGSVAAVVGGSNISLGLNYTIEPTNATLNNGTDITFQFNVSGTATITFMGFNISNGTTTLLLVNQTNDGSISGVLNTGNNSILTGGFTISTLNETIIITRTWKIEQRFIGDYSIFRQLTLFIDYGFKDFIRLLMVIATLTIVMIFMSREIGIDEEVKMAVGVLIVWAFSIVGWLDTGVAISSSSSSINDLSQFSNQYGIAIVSTVGAAYFILRRAFRQI